MNAHSRRQPDDFDSELRRADYSIAPSPLFVVQLRATLRSESKAIDTNAGSRPRGETRAEYRAAGERRTGRVHPGRSRIPKWAASIGLAPVVLLIVAMTFLTYRSDTNNPAAVPAAVAGTPVPEAVDYADVPMVGANPARTNQQPGPGIIGQPKLAHELRAAGGSMVLSDNMLIVSGPSKIEAIDATTYEMLWSTDLPRGAASAPTVADGQIYLSITGNTEADASAAAENPLVVLSMEDGHELWRVDGAGAYPATPIVREDVVYSLGMANGSYQIGAYRTTDGQPFWESAVGPFSWCCPRIGIALENRHLAVADSASVSVFDSVSGERQWRRSIEGGVNVSPPMILGDQVIVTTSDEIIGESSVISSTGSMTAYDISTGNVAWQNGSPRSFWSSLSASNDILYAGPWDDLETGRLALIARVDGQTIWSVQLPNVEGDSQSSVGLLADSAPVLVDRIAYIVTSTAPLEYGLSHQSSLLSAIDLDTGATLWMAQVDGMVISSPIVSGGRIFLLTYGAGLYVLEESAQTASRPSTTVDLRTPVACNAVPSTSPMLGELPATPSTPGVADWRQPVLFSHIPSGLESNVDAATASELEQRFNEYRACSDSDPYSSVYGFFSTDFYVRLRGLGEAVYNSNAQPWAIWMAPMQEFLYLDTGSLQMLPDGRIGGLIHSPMQNFYAWFVEEDGVWKIDEYHRIDADPVDPNAPTPAPSLNPEGTPYG